MKSSARHSLLRWVLCAAASAAVLNGASITYSVSTPNYPTPGQTGDWSADLAIPQFNDSNAILTAITFDLTAFIGVTASGTNTTGSDAIYTFRSFGAVVVYPPERLARDLFVYLPISGSFTVPPGPFSYTGPTRTGSTQARLRGAGDPFLAPYLGAGTVAFHVWGGENGPDDLVPGPVLMGPLGMTAGLHNTSAARLTVTYIYESIPEPATGMLFGCGLMLLVWRRAAWRRTEIPPSPLVKPR